MSEVSRPFPGRVCVSSAPGRLDLLGGVIDYSGGTTLEWPIAERTICDVVPAGGEGITTSSAGRKMTIPWKTLKPLPLKRYKEAIAPTDSWSLYILGCLGVLAETKGIDFEGGLELRIRSTVPEAKGVSSSAALEVAAMHALGKFFSIQFVETELALLCQRVENEVVGAPCGIMDQISCAYGRANALLPVTCQPAGFLAAVPLPVTLGILGIDSGTRHSIGASPYGRARTAAFMAKAWIKAFGPAQVSENLQYLVNLDLGLYRKVMEPRLPSTLTGEEFRQLGLMLKDPLSNLESGYIYPVRSAASHAIEVHNRVPDFMGLLQDESERPDAERRVELGKLLLRSHDGYGSIGLGSEGTDRLLEIVLKVPGILGGKITGGGSGGTVAFLYEPQRMDMDGLTAAIRKFEGESGKDERKCYVFQGSSDGACISN